MSFIVKNDFSLTGVIAKRGFNTNTIKDIYPVPKFDSNAELEAFANALNLNLEGVISNVRVGSFNYAPQNIVRPQDSGTAVTKTFRIKFNESPISTKMVIPYCKVTKIEDIANYLKTLHFMLGAQSLTVKAVSVTY